MKPLFKEHLNYRLKQLNQLMENSEVETLYIESGLADYYFLDDQTAPFRENPHFNFFCPAEGEGHILEIRKGQKPTLHLYTPTDFWHQHSDWQSAFWIDDFEIQEYQDLENFWKSASLNQSFVLSPTPHNAAEHGLSLVSNEFIQGLHWLRGEKTDYEVECLKKACELAALGHRAAKEVFYSGGSEFDILMAYLQASQQRETQLPYNPIIALDQHASILHYQNTSYKQRGQSFLIDAGAKFLGYCSDISRTYFQDSAHPLFKELCQAVSELQKTLIKDLHPGKPYPEVHRQAFHGISQILIDSGLVTGSSESLHRQGITQCFFPHGVGHPLGLQVHDVGAKQKNIQGDLCATDPEHPFLRTLRTILDRDILTIEPGIYFIPQLLNQLKENPSAIQQIQWGLVQELSPFGGIRIEDDVFLDGENVVNLSGPFLD